MISTKNSNAVSVQFLDSEMAETPTWTPQTVSDEELDLIVGDAGDNAVAVIGAVGEELEAGEHDVKTGLEITVSTLVRAKKLISGDLTRDDMREHVSDSIDFAAKQAGGPVAQEALRYLKSAGSALNHWRENAEKQDTAQDLIDAGVPDPGEG